ncbi:MAG: hypothetical protein K1X89_21965 [Myxococcaceae bacterium]|nr:hypothetical protein [Myxococcaceae bacterium]
MKLLLIETNEPESVRLSSFLAGCGHQPVVATNDFAACSAFASQALPVVLLCTRGFPDGGVRLLKQLRALERSAHPYVMLLGTDLTEPQLIQAYDAGANDDLRPPFSLPLLAARLRATETWLAHLEKTAAKAKPAPVAPKPEPVVVVPKGPPPSPVLQAAATQTWRSLASTFQSAASQFLTLPVGLTEPSAVCAPLAHACAITLSNAQLQLEIRIAVGIDARTASDLAMHVFGAEGDGLALDLLKELSNLLMGKTKTGLGGESLSFAGGLPEEISVEQLARPPVTFNVQDTFALSLNEHAMLVHVGIRSKANSMVVPAEMREGMVLAKDLFNLRGLLLVPGGTRLSTHMVDKLRGVLEAKARVEVMAP